MKYCVIQLYNESYLLKKIFGGSTKISQIVDKTIDITILVFKIFK